jgi:2-polyprenyl-6-hydroxyphenyl methylase / 3-demethylubiquinone-9 3-methyltransferase
MSEGSFRWTGNTGKAKIQMDLLGIEEPLRILDVGAVGTGPLDLWRNFPLGDVPFSVVAVDQDGESIRRARSLRLGLDLRAVNGYELSQHFAPEYFDIVVCTQVLEHVARPESFLAEISRVLQRNGQLWLTADSGHFEGEHHRDPLWKRLVRPLAAKVSERYYDFGITEQRLRHALDEAGFDTVDLLYCNLGPLKPLYANLSDHDAIRFMPGWLRFEEQLSRTGFRDSGLFRGLYVSARRR